MEIRIAFPCAFYFMRSPQEQRQFLIADIKKHGAQSSWDWDADVRFARFLDDTVSADAIQRACDSHSVLSARYSYWVHFGGRRICRNRMRRLRELVSAGFLSAGWVGLGAGGFSEFGIRRVRAYSLTAVK